MMSPAVEFCNIVSRVFVGTFFRDQYSPQAMRRNMDILSGYPRRLLKRRSPETTFESVDIKGMNAEIISTKANQKKMLLFLHGGGYFMGSVRSFRRIAWEISHLCNIKVMIIDYRLAPEHPYPAALEDAKKAYHFLRAKFPEMPLAIGGDSAGAGLALALTMSLRDEKQVMPDQVMAISPWADLIGVGESFTRNRKTDFWLSEFALRNWAGHYVGKYDPKEPYISPVFGDFSGFPPLLLFAGDKEVLLSDAQRVYESAKKAGVKAELHIGKDMQHDWFLAFPFLVESRRALETLKNFLDCEASTTHVESASARSL